MLAAVRCPECTAPVRPDTTSCAFCGVAFAVQPRTGGRTEEHFTLVVRVGPSNVDRVVKILEAHLHLPADDLRAKLASPPARIEIGPIAERAYAISHELSEGGAQTEITSREVTVPVHDVTLRSAGPTPLKVIAVLRAEIELTVPEAKRIVAELPCVIATRVEEAVARALVTALEAAGASATC